MTLAELLKVVETDNFLVLDTETTGITDGSEICQIAIISAGGDVLMDSFVRPVNSIPFEATRIHGISDDTVANAPRFVDIVPDIAYIIGGCDLIVYNAKFDRHMLHSSARAANLPKTEWKTLARWWCAMEAFAEFYGDFNDYHGSYTWKRLSVAADELGVPRINVHSALGDCQMTLGVVKAMLAKQQS